MAEFNKTEFANLLKLAKGDRSINQYATHADVAAAHISRLLRGMLDTPPNPPIIKKLADKAYNNVKYEDLMNAAGHNEYVQRIGRVSRSEDQEFDLIDMLDNKRNLTAGGQPLTQEQRLNLLRALANPTLSEPQADRIYILGNIRAGIPLLSEQNRIGELDIPADLVGKADFALIVNGDSMIGSGINEGDIVLCKQKEEAYPGQIVVALVNNDETTLKYYFLENGQAVLRAANPEPKYKDIIMQPEDRIEGVVVRIQKEPPNYKIFREYLYLKEAHKQEWNGIIEKAIQNGMKAKVIKEMVNFQLELARKPSAE